MSGGAGVVVGQVGSESVDRLVYCRSSTNFAGSRMGVTHGCICSPRRCERISGLCRKTPLGGCNQSPRVQLMRLITRSGNQTCWSDALTIGDTREAVAGEAVGLALVTAELATSGSGLERGAHDDEIHSDLLAGGHPDRERREVRPDVRLVR